MFDNAQLMRRWFDEVWSQHRAEVIEELMAPDAIGHGLGDSGEGVQGREGFRAMHARFCGAFPDLRITVDDAIAEGDRAAVRVTVTGTHQGDHLGFPATGRAVHFTGMVFSRWHEGQLVEGWNEFNFAQMMAQLQPANAEPPEEPTSRSL